MHLVSTHSHNSNVQGGHGYWIKNEQDRMARALVRIAMSKWVGALHKLDPAHDSSVRVHYMHNSAKQIFMVPSLLRNTQQRARPPKKTASAPGRVARRAGCKTEGGAICRRQWLRRRQGRRWLMRRRGPVRMSAADGATLSLAPRPPAQPCPRGGRFLLAGSEAS